MKSFLSNTIPPKRNKKNNDSQIIIDRIPKKNNLNQLDSNSLNTVINSFTNIPYTFECVHHSKVYYCISCSVLVCNECSNSSHKLHQFAISKNQEPITLSSEIKYCMDTSQILSNVAQTISHNHTLLHNRMEEWEKSNTDLKLNQQLLNHKITHLEKLLNETLKDKSKEDYQIANQKDNGKVVPKTLKPVQIFVISSDKKFDDPLKDFIQKQFNDNGFQVIFKNDTEYFNNSFQEKIPSLILYVICTAAKRIHYEDYKSEFEKYCGKPNTKTFLTFICIGAKSDVPSFDGKNDTIALISDINTQIIQEATYSKKSIIILKDSLQNLYKF